MTENHSSFTTSAAEYCIVDNCQIINGQHCLVTEGLRPAVPVIPLVAMEHSRRTAIARTVTTETAGASNEAAPSSTPTEAPAPTKRKRRTKAEMAAARDAEPMTDPERDDVARAMELGRRVGASAKPKPEPADKDDPFTPAVLVGEVVDIGNDPWREASDIVDVIRAMMQERPREPMGNIGPSMLGGCERKIGYQLAFGSTGERDDGSWIARVGTAVHTELDDMFRGRVEADGSRRWFTSVRIAKPVRGVIDVYDARRLEVIDFKVVGATTMTKARRGEIDIKYDVQLDVYGVGLMAAGYHVERVAVLFLPKTQGLDKAVWYSRPIDVGRAVQAIERLRKVETVIGEATARANAGSTAGEVAMALDALAMSEDYCGSCPAKAAGYCPGVVKIERMPEWPAYDAVLERMENAA